jgi:hypothetical protein
VTEVEAEHIGTGLEQGFDGIEIGTCGSQCGNNFGIAMAAHEDPPMVGLVSGYSTSKARLTFFASLRTTLQ